MCQYAAGERLESFAHGSAVAASDRLPSARGGGGVCGSKGRGAKIDWPALGRTRGVGVAGS